ncbi:MAG: gfo/Idh/MocA family oxidoreductase, partial [Planctomycetales bacterium]|nr:gfo/Idh/MocA family oxidoreductase [Planctomycetales bacterium]
DETGRVFQVGTQQRSEMGRMFLNAVAIIRDGRIGDIQKTTVAIGGAPTSGPIPVVDVPAELDWNQWLGQAPFVDYRAGNGKTRCHYEFRWWYEYSGGKMTDWGAHHVDIAQWGMQLDHTGPVSVDGQGEHPVPFENGVPMQDDQYNTATKFTVSCKFAGGQELLIRDRADDLGFDNGILFEGTEGRIFVNRGKLTGRAVEELKDRPLSEEILLEVYKGKRPQGGNAHMQNFFECIETREQPISDVYTHHRAMTTCHLANIAIRLGRPLKWNPETQHIEGDDDAAAWERRQQREGFEIDVTL